MLELFPLSLESWYARVGKFEVGLALTCRKVCKMHGRQTVLKILGQVMLLKTVGTLSNDDGNAKEDA